jgi:SAM-dependent methyltransferase
MSVTMNLTRGWLAQAHGAYVFSRRVQVLSSELANMLPRGARVLDVGCGDGSIAALIEQQRPDLTLTGIDVLVRPHTRIAVTAFDGATIPYGDGEFDAVLFVDVLHHTPDPLGLLREAARVARTAIVLKDHTRDGWLAEPTLRLMDYVGNAPHGVALPYNYWSEREWRAAFAELAWRPSVWRQQLQLYPWPASLLFERSLHFIARLEDAA